MNRIAAAADALGAEITTASARIGRRIVVDPRAALDRSDSLALRSPGQWSANGTCRLLRARDGWVAVNLSRPCDRELVPAWTGREGEPWRAVAEHVADDDRAELIGQAQVLVLPVAAVGERSAGRDVIAVVRMGSLGTPCRAARVVDLSTLWAGPLCGSILARVGFAVSKVECRRRPDPRSRLHGRLNGDKQAVALDFTDGSDRATLLGMIAGADIVITSARPSALARLGITPANLFSRAPHLVWVAITAHGWGSERVGFGDDAAAAGGLVRWSDSGAPMFDGDASADPLTGLAAAGVAMRAIEEGGGVLIDAALSSVAAWAARGDA